METKSRKPTRLKNYNYSSNGIYFITLCSKNRKHIFSSVVGDGVLDVPHRSLSEYGRYIEEQLHKMASYYNNIELDNYVVMPNHIHLLLRVENNGMSGVRLRPDLFVA